ncbi:hypothetical protein ACM42_02375 [Bradyrhizobium sp. CCBAU 25338]|nr:hypothetical protein [Bradyrhizobium sp. CCBAU 45389]MDA9527300.1 hypothetical protein [Bradyrhizobium sp. CCBAU 25338]RXH33313.1 hypothetical protein XH84_10090 [Bradyrhizobium nanningense]
MSGVIRKFWEDLGYGRKSNRVFYVSALENLPSPRPGVEWREDTQFRQEEAIEKSASFARVVEAALRDGVVSVDSAVGS